MKKKNIDEYKCYDYKKWQIRGVDWNKKKMYDTKYHNWLKIFNIINI